MVEILEKLEVFNKFKFNEDIHKYYCNGKEMSTSVTRFIEQFEEPFDSDYWAEVKAKEEGISTEEMLARWESKSLVSKVLGTSLHATIELLFNNKIFCIDEKKIKEQCENEEEYNKILDNYKNMVPIVSQYYADAFKKILPIRLEMVLGDEELDIAGCLDGLFWNKKTKRLEIFDYKSNEKFTIENRFQKLKYPFNKLQQTSLNKYSIQLSIYKYFLRKHTGLDIGDCWLVHFDRTTMKYTFYKCLDLTKEVELVFNEIIKNRKKAGIN